MRWLIRSLLFWAITLPLFYLFGLPFLMGKLEEKARAQSYQQCQTHLQTEGMVGAPTSFLKAPQAEEYCRCVSAPIRLTRADLPELVRTHQSARLTEAMKPAVEACNTALQAIITNAINSAPPPRVTRDADGTETVHFN